MESKKGRHSPDNLASLGLWGILYIAGWGRSGSTIIGNLLDQGPDVIHAGEIRYWWERGLMEDRLCGCGQRISQCDFWTDVLHRYTELNGGLPEPSAMLQMHQKYSRTRSLFKLALAHSDQTNAWVDNEYTKQLYTLYKAIHEVSGARLIVDSSKTPMYG
jgi:hypothetical protein